MNETLGRGGAALEDRPIIRLDEEIIGEEVVEEPAPDNTPEFDREFASDGEGMPDALAAFGGPMDGGSGHVKE